MKYILTEQEIFPFRPKPFYFITSTKPEELTLEKMRESLIRLKDSGFGGIVLFNKPPAGFNEETYLSESWFEMVENAAKACKELSLTMWINDGFNFPPGDVAGRVRKAAPHLTQKHIKIIDGKLAVLDEEWGFPAFEERESTELFIKFVYEEYEKRVGNYFGDPIKGFFSDTDNRRVNSLVMFSEEHPMRDYFPWSTTFEKSFTAEYGYDIIPYMPEILERKDLPQAVDYWEHAGRLMHGWFKAHHEWLNSRGLEYTGHTSDSSPYLYEEAPRSSCFTEGRFSDCERNFDYPGTDQELYSLDSAKPTRLETYYTPTVIWGMQAHTPKMTDFYDVSIDLRAKQASATAFLYKRKGVMSEMFAGTNYGVEPKILRQIAAFQIMQGVTFVVPHAYHYRFTDESKYFAPPDFSHVGMLNYAVRELNDEIARLTAMMAKGQSVYPVALIDPTEYVWRGKYKSSEYFNVFATLNRLPYGFTICDVEKLLSKDYKFKVAIAAGIVLSEEIKTKIAEKGIVLLGAEELDRLKTYIPCDVKYAGEGSPHFVRKIIDGEEFAFIANIESDRPIRGVVYAYGKEKEILLYPGEVRYISAHYDDIPEIKKTGERLCEIPESVHVVFDRSNVLPLEWFKNGENTVLKTETTQLLSVPFRSTTELSGLKLYIPKSCKDLLRGVYLDGAALTFTLTNVYDDEYLEYLFPTVIKGTHELEIHRDKEFLFHNRIFISGEFDVDVKTSGDEYKKLCSLYNLSVYIPSKTAIVFSERRKTLSVHTSWALQGQPFYSGGVEYSFDVTAKKDGNYTLHLPKVRDVADLCINGEKIGRIIAPPYTYNVRLRKGKNVCKLTVYNSFANTMECYLEESGILQGGEFREMK